MRTRLEHLENNEAVLLMYLFDELSVEDRAEVERMIQTDGGLRAQYEALRDVHGKVQSLIDEADHQTVMPVAPAAADRQVMRMIQRWSSQRTSTEAAAHRKRGIPIWVYPVATAAAVLLATMIWWGFNEGGTNFLPSITDDNRLADAPEPEIAPQERQTEVDVHFALLRSFENNDEMNEVEQQMQALAERRDEGTPILSLDPMSR